MPDESLSGVVERVTFHNPENGFLVLRVQLRGRRDLVTVVGHAPAVNPGEHVEALGRWVHDRVHGPQFQCSTIDCLPPTSEAGIEKYLRSGLIKGIGPFLARQLVVAFGTDVFDVIERMPERLQTVRGIGPVRAGRILASWAEQKAVRAIMVFLHDHGVGTSRAVRIFRTYGGDSIKLIREDPYRLARDIRGIGFQTADRVAESLGIEKTALIRARAGLSYVLARATDEGHCGLPVERLTDEAKRLLEIPETTISEALALETADGTLVADELDGRPCVFLAGLHASERAIASRLARLGGLPASLPPIDALKAIEWVERRRGMTLAPSQRDAIALALRSRVVVITGGPGVGKTTILESLLAIVRAKGVRPALCAPTGRAAKRLAEVTGLEAKTIHRLLEADPRTGGFRRAENNPLECDLLVVDETSMVDVPLMHALLKALPPRAALVLVGDADQLPSVGPGCVLSDVIASGRVPVVRLTEVFRQASESRIIVNAHRINRGEMPDLTPSRDSDFHFVQVAEPEAAAERTLEIVADRIPRRFGLDPVSEVQVLCPMNRGLSGARALNLELQKRLNPNGAPFVERFGWRFGTGDKVMQVENDYDKDVYNGDIGRIETVDPEGGTLTVIYDGRPVTYDLDDLDRLVPAYACTIHKAQGSEYPAVVVPVSTQHYPMLQRALIYTAVTRGRRLVVLVGQVKALATAVRGRLAPRRWTKLRAWLSASSTAAEA
ncbi:MAG: ATP-dependent RecD-like DNA helicase [Vicinamibacterales bacterium]